MLNRWQRTIVDLRGNVAPFAVITVRRESDQGAAVIYKDFNGNEVWPNGEVTANENGFAFFYCESDFYRISNDSLSIDWREVAIVGEALMGELGNVEQRAAEAEQAANIAKAARDRAHEWAENPEDVQVDAGEYSAHHWAIKSAASASDADGAEQAASNSADLAKDWAIKTDAKVKGEDYSAKWWAQSVAGAVGEAKFFSSKQDGLAGTSQDEFFWVAGNGELELFKNEGTAESVFRYGDFTNNILSTANNTFTGTNEFQDKVTVDDDLEVTGDTEFANMPKLSGKPFDETIELGQPEITGSVSFTKSSNQVVLTDIVPKLGLEVGDVIEVTGASADSGQNNGLRTVESITDDDTIIVNYEHRNDAGSLSLTDETKSVTVKRIEKWHSAPIGLGQAWVDVTAMRTLGVEYINSANRSIEVSYCSTVRTDNNHCAAYIDGELIFSHYFGGGSSVPASRNGYMYLLHHHGEELKITSDQPKDKWFERR